jgi:beta-1,4-mannosyltransferase
MDAGDGGNPYIPLLYRSVQAVGDVSVINLHRRNLMTQPWDILHVHWPDLAIRTDTRWWAARDRTAFLALILAARARGTKLVWTAHNLMPHDSDGSPSAQRFMARFIDQVDHVIALSQSSVEDLRQAYPHLGDVPVSVIPHGHYRDAYVNEGPTSADARAELGVRSSGSVLLHVGQIRPYKNIVELVGRFRQVGAPDDHLIVAGQVTDAGLRRSIVAAASDDTRVTLILERVDDNAFQVLFAAADVVILPYRNVLNSGSAILALSFDRPVILPAVGSLIDLRDDVGPDWVRLYDGPLTDRVIENGLRDLRPSGPAPLDSLSWDRVGRLTVQAYEAAMVSRRRRLL